MGGKDVVGNEIIGQGLSSPVPYERYGCFYCGDLGAFPPLLYPTGLKLSLKLFLCTLILLDQTLRRLCPQGLRRCLIGCAVLTLEQQLSALDMIQLGFNKGLCFERGDVG